MRVAPEGTKVNLPVVAPDSNQTVLRQKWKRDDATWIHNNKIACSFVECGIFREEGVFILVAEGRTWRHDASQITSGKSHFSHLNINQNQQFFFDTTIQTTDVPRCPPLSFLRPALWVNMPRRESSWW
jgi:hypothetical protein